MYAFGVLMWEIFHGKRAWEGLNHAQVPSLPLQAARKPHACYPWSTDL